MSAHEPSTPQTREEIRAQVSFRRWRVFETVEAILGEMEEKVDWERIYDGDGDLNEYASWGLYLEGAIPAAGDRIRGVAAEPEPAGARPEPQPAELEDHLFWGAKQIAGGMQQTLSLLSRQIVSSLTGTDRQEELPDDRERDRQRELCMVIAEAAGKLRSDLRRFAAFVVAGETWDSNEIEIVLFPQKTQELALSQRLRDRLVDTMEGFQGSERRLPISEVLRQWRHGQVWGSSALAEIDMLIRSLGAILEREYRQALYVDSYYRLKDWIAHLRGCSEGLRQHLGNELVEDTLTKEIAAILDADMLAGVLGEELARDLRLPRDMPKLLGPMTTRQISKLELGKARQTRLLELKKAMGRPGQEKAPKTIDESDEEIVREAVGQFKGKRLVDQLRVRAPLSGALTHLEHLHPLVIDSEEGLKTYLMLLYGQIQNRDLKLLQVDQKEVPIAEKRLGVLELEYQISRLSSTQRYEAFELVRRRVAAGQPIDPEEWQGLRGFLETLVREIAPRVERIAAYEEVQGLPEDGADRLVAAVQEIAAIEDAPEPSGYRELKSLLNTLVAVLSEFKAISISAAPPQTEAEIEDFLNMMG